MLYLPDGAIVENSARVALPERQRGRRSSAQVHEWKVVPHLIRVVSHGRDVAEAKLPRSVIPPALYRAANQDGARVAEAGDDGVAYLPAPEVHLSRDKKQEGWGAVVSTKP